MNLGVISRLSVLLLVSAGCASPPPLRESPEVSVIGASVKTLGLFGGHNAVKFAYFVRLDEGDAPLRAVPIRSNFRQDEYVFLFNAQPGRYGLVAVGRFNQASKPGAGVGGGVGGGFSVGVSVSAGSSRNIIYYLPKALIEKTIVSVGSGDWAFIGNVILDKADWEGADEVQQYYSEVLAPGYQDLNWFQKWMMFYGAGHYAVVEESLDQGEESLARFLENSRELAGEEWAGALLSPVAAGPLQGQGDREVDPVAAAAEPEESTGSREGHNSTEAETGAAESPTD